MVDIRSTAAEIRRGKKRRRKERNYRAKIYMVSLLHRATIMSSYGQFSEVQKLRDLELDPGSGQGHMSVHSTCRTTSLPNHVTVASRSTEI